jgi:hypothetical protein
MATVETIQMQRNSGGARSDATALPNHDRKYGVLQNLSASEMYGKFGEGCTTSDYDFKLKACAVAGDASGGSLVTEENGIITVAGTGLSYTAWER